MTYGKASQNDAESLKKHKSGFFVKKSTAYIICLSFILVLVGVACLFYFVPDRGTCADLEDNEDNGLPPIPEDSSDPPDLGQYDGRLPDTIIPINYWLKLQVYLDVADGARRFEYDGQVNITLRCRKATKTITLHHRMIDVDHNSVTVTKVSSGQTLTVVNISSEDQYEFLTIQTDELLEENNEYLLKISFIGYLGDTILNGFYRSYYDVQTDTGVERRWLATTQFQSAAARKAFPCFDEPHLKATFDVVLIHRPSRTALSNMEEIRQISDGTWTETHFNTSVVMSVYLVAFLVSDFETLEMYTTKGILLRVWAQPEYIHSANYSMYAGAEMLTSFADILDQPYQLTKMDMAAIPQFSAGAMENWGLVLYRESAMLYDPTIHAPSRRGIVASYVAHELAHMWFGNQVTMQWWDHLWLNEGFATFGEYIGADVVEPEWRTWDWFLRGAMSGALESDAVSSTSKPLIRETGWLIEVNLMFDSMSYSKGGCIVRQLYAFLDSDVIKNGIKEYLEIHKYENVVTDDLWDALTRADRGRGDTNVKLAMDTWTLQPGHPIVTVTRSTSDVAVLSQERFFSDPNDNHTDQWPNLEYKWYIPVTYTNQDDWQEGQTNPHKIWMNRDSAEIDLSEVSKESWILVNINKTGMYRVTYDDDNWNKLAAQLKTNHHVFTSQTRASLLDDAFTVSRAMHTDHINAFKISEYLRNEEEYIAWELAVKALPYTDQMLLRTAEYGMHENYWRYLVSPTYETFGWDFEDSYALDYFHRQIAVQTACNYNHKDCVDHALQLFDSWMQAPENNSIPEEVKEEAYCAAIRNGGLEEWQFAYQQINSNSSERSLLESALGCTKDSWLLQRYMEEYHDNNDAATAISSCKDKSSQGFYMAWMFTLTNFDSLFERYNVTAYTIVWDFAPWMNTEQDLEQLLQFGRKYNDMPEVAADGFYSAKTTIETNIDWMNRNHASIKTWLADVTDRIGLVL
ncbi:aminopeptidase N-like [Ptychodera flava]|uniref:aminopeptidase N-like n=1 Tax=Ptychodera flava TaxID=63121 RepID=UPI00396A34FA